MWGTRAKLAQRVVLRTSQGPLRPLWLTVYERVSHWLSRQVTAGEHEVTTYVRGGLGTADLVPGLSDVDMIAVVAEDTRGPRRAHGRIRARYDRLRGRHPLAGRLLGHFFVFEERDLEAAAGAAALTFGLDETGQPERDRAAYLGPAPVQDEIGFLERPGLYGATADWRLLDGPDRLPAGLPRTAQDERIAAWLELQSWWRWAFDAVLDPGRPHVPYLCFKLVAEPCRIWLWLTRRERYDRRTDALLRAAELLPDEREAIDAALALYRALPASPPPPLAESLGALTRLSSLVARELASQVERADTQEVRLVGGEPSPGAAVTRPDPGLLPLADWRACVLPSLLDLTFRIVPGDPSDPAAVAAAARRPGSYDALRRDELLVFPTASIWQRGLLRAVQCPLTDPVSFAVADGRSRASFPRVRGWSVEDLARRAVAEHRAWLRGESAHRSVRLWLDQPPARGERSAHALATLLSAARAALLLETVQQGEPALALTAAGIAQLLAERGDEEGRVAAESVEAYERAVTGGAAPPARVVERLDALVGALPGLAVPDGRPAPA